MGTSNLRYLYWTPFQQLAHHASSMCGMATGDLLGTGTISGDVRNTRLAFKALINCSIIQAVDNKGNKKELGCLYEAIQAGTKPITLSDGTEMNYLADGDEIVLEGWCEDANGSMILGFGECRGKLLPAFDN